MFHEKSFLVSYIYKGFLFSGAGGRRRSRMAKRMRFRERVRGRGEGCGVLRGWFQGLAAGGYSGCGGAVRISKFSSISASRA